MNLPKGFLFDFLQLINGFIKSKNKLFYIKEMCLYPFYGVTYLDKEYYLYFKRLSKYILKDQKKITVIDVGANRGWFVRIAHRFFDVEKSYCYEPIEANIKELDKIAAKYKNTTIRNICLGERKGSTRFYIYGSDGLSSTRPLSQSFQFEKNIDLRAIKKTVVDVSTLDLEFDGNAQNDAYIIKLDTQASEYEILKGGEKLLRSERVKAIIIEILVSQVYQGQPSWVSILNLLSEYKYDLFDSIVGYRNADGSIAEYDMIFIRK